MFPKNTHRLSLINLEKFSFKIVKHFEIFLTENVLAYRKMTHENTIDWNRSVLNMATHTIFQQRNGCLLWCDVQKQAETNKNNITE